MKKDIKHFLIDPYKLTLDITGAHYNYDNLFNGEKLLGDNVLKVINENPIEVFADVKSGTESSFALVFKALAQQVFDKIPAKEVLW